MSTVDYVRVFEGEDEQWYYQSRANNHQTLSTSEGYTRREDALKAAGDEHPNVIIKLDTGDDGA